MQIAVSSKGFLAAADDSGDVKVLSTFQVYAHKRWRLLLFLLFFNKYEIPCVILVLAIFDIVAWKSWKSFFFQGQ